MMRLVIGIVVLGLGGCANEFAQHRPLLTPEDLQRTRQVTSIDDANVLGDSWAPTIDGVPELLLRDRTVTTVDIDLAAVRDAVIRDNLGIEIERYSAAISFANIGSERGAFDGSFGLDATWSKAISPQLSLANPRGSIEQDSLTLAPRFEIPLATGGSISVGASAERYTSTPKNIPLLGADASSGDVVSTTLSLSQPLLRNAGTTVALSQIVLAEYSARRAAAGVTLEIVSTLRSAEQAYWSAWQAARQFDAYTDILALAKEQLEITKALYEAQQATIVDVHQARASVLSHASSVVSAQETLLQASYSLERLMNSSSRVLDGSTVLHPTEDPTLRAFETDPRRAIEYAMHHRMDLLQLELEVAASALGIEVARNGMLPDLTLALSVGATGITDEGLTQAFRDMANGAEPFPYSVGLSTSISLGNESAEAAYRAAVLQRLQYIATRSQQELTIRQDVLNATTALQTASQSIEINVRGESAYRAAWEGTVELFRMGQQTAGDVAEALERYADARASYIESLASYENALSQMAFATGTTLGRHNIEWRLPIAP